VAGWLGNRPLLGLTRIELRQRLRAATPALLIAFNIAVVSVLVATLLERADTGDRVVVGNTLDLLTSSIEIDDYRILVGAGPSRSHSADMVGRTTRPWDRRVDLLIIPGWDRQQATGAIGLIEREQIEGVVVVGIPGAEPVWALLEREVDRADIPIRFLDGAHSLQVGDDLAITMVDLASTNGREGAWIRLDYEGKRIDFVDAEPGTPIHPPARAISQRNDHLIVHMRRQLQIEGPEPAAVVRPDPFFDQDMVVTEGTYLVEPPRNQRVTIRLDNHQMRIPFDMVDQEAPASD
jgi:hypothetical protein